MESTIRVTIWNEFVHERQKQHVRALYPHGIHTVIGEALKQNDDLTIRYATLEQPQHGLTQDTVDSTDVMLWWSHCKNDAVSDEVAARVQKRVLQGMGLIALHAAKNSKIFKSLMGTTCAIKWREAAEKERIWNIEPSHPIARNIGDYIELPNTEMYGERFDIPTPDKLIFISWYEGGEVFRSGCTWQRGHGKIFFFAPGHEDYPIYHNKQIQQVITNAIRWAAPEPFTPTTTGKSAPLEKLSAPQ